MARILDGNLIAALDREEHQPALEINSEDFVATIPFDGNAFNFSTEREWRPYMVYHSSGRITALVRDVTPATHIADTATLIYTDPDRTIWRVAIPGLSSGTEGNIDYMALCERPDGNLSVIMARYGYLDSTGTIYRAVITPTGTVVESPTSITTYPRATNGSYGMTGLSLARFANGTYYCVYCYTTASSFVLNKLTSTNWSSWTGPTAISHGLTTTDRQMTDAYVFQTDETDCFLMFSYSDVQQGDVLVFNVYSMLSTNSGSTWGTPEARTLFTDLGSSAFHPVLVQKSSGVMHMVFHERNNVLLMNADALGWAESEAGGCPYGWNTRTIYRNPATGYLTVSTGHSVSSGSGTRSVCAVLVIDPETWQIVDNFNEFSTPSINGLFSIAQLYEGHAEFAQGSKFVAMVTPSYEYEAVLVLDVVARTVQYYVIAEADGGEPFSAYGLYVNIVLDSEDFPSRTHFVRPQCAGVALNESSADELWLVWVTDYFERSYYVGYIDLTAAPDAYGKYSVNFCGGRHGSHWDRFDIEGVKWLTVLDNEGYVIVAGDGGGSWQGGLAVHSKATGSTLWEWTAHEDTDFPWRGVFYSRPKYYNGQIFFNILYYNAVNYDNQRGLCVITLATEAITYVRPSFETLDNYSLFGYYAVDEENNHMYIAPYVYDIGGNDIYYTVVRYDLNSGVWTAYTSETMPGLPKVCTTSTGQNVVFDSDTGNVVVALGHMYGDNAYEGIAMFNVGGSFTQVKYLTAEYAAGWDWQEQGDITSLVLDTTSLNAAVAIDEDDVLWALWDDYDFVTDVYVPTWDRDLGEFDIMDFLVGQVKLRWELKKPNTLTFTLARGHLFDPENTYSTLRDIVKKGRKLTVRMGEVYNGSEYLENQGEFLVTEIKLRYSRGQYPLIQVRAESLCTIWKEQNVVATTLYSAYPDDMLTNVLTAHAQMQVGEYNIPGTFVDEHLVEHQFIDMEVWDIVEEICDHWFYVPYDDPDGVFTLIYMDISKAVDHVYSDLNKIVEFTPDDAYSDFTNAVRVTGETQDYLDVLYDEELITSLAGTVGWWEKKTTHKVRYSEDDSRECRDPRLLVIQSIQLQGLLMDMLSSGDGDEYISYEDPDEKYIIVTIEVPDLTAAVVAAIIAMVAVGALAIGCDGWVTGWCGAMIAALAIAVSIVMYLLSAVANYQYEIYARPIGEEKQSIEYTAHDTEHQQQLRGRIVRQDIDDGFCYSVSECRRVAEGNLAIVQAQRRRVRFKKVAHMQDEIMDKIQVNHPFSAEAMQVFITGLTRVYKKGTDGSSGMYDEIEGWRTL